VTKVSYSWILDARRRRTPGRETEKPAPGVNSRADGREKENIEFSTGEPSVLNKEY